MFRKVTRRRGWKKRAVSREKVDLEDRISEERMAEVVNDEVDHNKPFVKPGYCQKGSCGNEAACLNYQNNTYTCICPHDRSPPTADGRCTRITVPPTPHPIKNIRLSTEGNGTLTKNKIITNLDISLTNTTSTLLAQPAESTLEATTNIKFVLLGAIATVSLLAFVLAVICIRKKTNCFGRKKNCCSQSPSPIVLKRNFLIPERYAPNPQYSACTGTSVPVLRRDTLNFLNEIGEGCFGKVFKGELHAENGEHVEVVAIKVLKESATREIEEDFFREVDIMSAFRHENILPLLGVVLRENGYSPMMVFEYMPHGDLAEVLRAQRTTPNIEDPLPRLTSNDLMSIAMQIANGMSYLASQRFVHRDLACRNCLVTSGPVVKIADFGMSRDVYTCDYYKIGGSRLLPVRWMSPESVMYGRFTLESDIWSYGIILWEIFSYGKQPYYGHTNEEVVKLILQGIMLIPPDDCPPIICELMRSCWKTEPRDRIKFVEISERLGRESNEDTTCDKTLRKQSMQNLVFEMEKTTSSLGRELKQLPRPPPLLPPAVELDILDAEGYLVPIEVKAPPQYLQPLPD